MSLNNLSQRGNKWVVDGEVKQFYCGRDSFKLANMLSLHFTGHAGWERKAKAWIEHNQRLLGQDVILRVFGETGFWEDHPMFGSEPADQGIWDLDELRRKAETGQRVKSLTPLNEKIIDWLMHESQETGCAFEYVVDATIKHGEGMTTAISDHAIRQTAEYMRLLYDDYPNAKIIIEARNEWRAHNRIGTKLNQVNLWAERFYRWNGPNDKVKLSFETPGEGWTCRQWPEGYIIVDGTKDELFHYDVGPEPGKFKMGLTHPDRSDDWWNLPPTMAQMRADCRGVPLGFNESMMIADKADKERCAQWYRAAGHTTNLMRYLEWLEKCREKVDYFIIHDEKGMQCDVNWPRRETDLEAELRGGAPPGPVPPDPPEPPEPPGPPESQMFFDIVINLAYRQILGRPDGADPTGLRDYNQKMRNGMTKAEMEESLIRSEEFKKKNKRKKWKLKASAIVE